MEELLNKMTAIEEELKRITSNNTTNNTTITDKTTTGWIYLLQIHPYNENVYKIGKTHNITKRLPAYKKDLPKIMSINYCEDYEEHEKKLILLFNETYTKLTDRGSEYFGGNGLEMINTLHLYFCNKIKKEDEENEEEQEEQEETTILKINTNATNLNIIVNNTQKTQDITNIKYYICPRCGYNSTKLSNIQRHVQKVKLCEAYIKNITPTLTNIETKIKCILCNKYYKNFIEYKKHKCT